MRILFVAMPHSVHTARWINQLTDYGHDIYLFPSQTANIHPGLKDVKTYLSGSSIISTIKIAKSIRNLFKLDQFSYLSYLMIFWDRSFWLAQVIRRLKPNIIHSLEIQHAGYITLAARERLGYDFSFPKWVVSNWGSDIYLFGRLDKHVGKIKAVLASCDYYMCECHRDIQLANEMGLKSPVLPVLPNTGGFELERVLQFRQSGLISNRRLILVKGYQNFAGRALVALRAIALCTKELRNYRVGIYSASPDVIIAAELLSQSSGLPIEVIAPCTHDKMLCLHGQARIYIGLSISDGISTSLLEAIVMGAFPIQSCTSCANEWIVDGLTGLIVPPEDPKAVATAILRAVSDDELVNHAAMINAHVVRERLDQSIIKHQVMQIYDKISGLIQ